MAFVNVSPELVAAAAQNLAGIGSTLSEAPAGFENPITSVATAAEDEVSAAIAAVFSAHGQEFQALSAQAAKFHAQFVQALGGAGKAYAATDAANVSPLQTIQSDVATVVRTIQTDVAALVQTLQSWGFLLGGSGNTAVVQLLILGAV